MKPNGILSRSSNQLFPSIAAVLFTALLLGKTAVVLAQTAQPTQAAQPAQSQVMTTTSPAPEEAPKIPNDQLDSLVAPIALYPDPLLAQTLAASTYPLEVIQLQQWMDRNKDLKDKALADAVAKQPWDPSVQALAAAPDVVQRLAGNIQWTTDLGNAFLAQQSDVMDAVQRMRGKAESKGTLKTSVQQKVETRTVEGGKQVIVVEPADPEVVYVPSYDPTVVYGAAPAAYPYYPYTYPGYYPGMGLAWGAAGFALGAWAGGYWGNCDWGHGDVNINNKNNFNRNTNINRGNRTNISNRPGAGGGNRWQHNPGHRGNAPYGDRRTADRFGGRTQGGGNRPGGIGGAGGAGRPGGIGGAGGAGRPGGIGGAGGAGRPGGIGGAGGAGRPGGIGGAGGAGRPGGGAGARPSTRPAGGGGANRVGNRSASARPSAGSRGGGFGGGGSGNFARASSSRGGRSMGGGGFSRGGGGRGGGGMSRGGGGGRGGGGRGGGGGGRR
jgi:Protein of unknown function (DUF3300)